MKTDGDRLTVSKYQIVVWTSYQFEQILEREPTEREEIEGKMEDGKSSTKEEYTSKYWRGTKITITFAPSLAKKTRDLMDTNRAYTNKGSWENKYSCDKPTIIVGRIYT